MYLGGDSDSSRKSIFSDQKGRIALGLAGLHLEREPALAPLGAKTGSANTSILHEILRFQSGQQEAGSMSLGEYSKPYVKCRPKMPAPSPVETEANTKAKAFYGH